MAAFAGKPLRSASWDQVARRGPGQEKRSLAPAASQNVAGFLYGIVSGQFAVLARYAPAGINAFGGLLTRRKAFLSFLPPSALWGLVRTPAVSGV